MSTGTSVSGTPIHKSFHTDASAESGRSGVNGQSGGQPQSSRTSDSAGGGPHVPQVSRPAGGGAIRGLGERLDVNPANGTCQIEVPLVLPEGRASLGEKLVLSYGSGAGESSFGIGWALSVPQISRRTDKGVPAYGASSTPDVFLLSSLGDLVPYAETDHDGAPLGQRAEVSGWSIQRYRPRSDSLDSRIEHWRPIGKPQDPGHWRVTTSQNVTYLYGFDVPARVSDPRDPDRTFSWLLQEVRDDRGNAAIYRYKAEDGVGVSDSAHELHRLVEASYRATAQRYLKRVLYANLKPVALDKGSQFNPYPWEVPERHDKDWCYEVVFDYGEHDDEAPTLKESSAWAVRRDGLSSYRSGFEVRTLRQCRRILLFQRLPGTAATPASSMECIREHRLSYQLRDGVSYLESIEVLGIGRDASNRAVRDLASALPPVRFNYSNAGEPVMRSAGKEAGPLPRGQDAKWARWVDLNGEGMPGVLWEQGNTWYYRANHSLSAPKPGQRSELALPEHVVEFASPVRLRAVPSGLASNPGSHLIADVDGDGRLDLVKIGERDMGYWSREGLADTWEEFRAFRQVPDGVRGDPQARWVDLTGDGLPDILITRSDELIWLHSLGSAGYEKAMRLLDVPHEPSGGHAAVFADGTETLFIADMSGDGLPDLVRIRNGSVVYWPSLGHGRFGSPVVMSSAPQLDHPHQFDPHRIRLADIDGSGTTDILYLNADRVDVYANVAGNRWVRRPSLLQLPQWSPNASVETVDIFGNGTSCLVWSGQTSGGQPESLKVLDLVGGIKPHLLVSIDNGYGGQTLIGYTTSAREYLQDKLSGTPWHTRLPFPVQVVNCVTRLDKHAATQHTTRYRYHHGHYDGPEREFRGFAFVEEWNTEASGLGEAARSSDEQPPRLIKRWFHTGAWLRGDLARRLSRDYWTDRTEQCSLNLDALRLFDTPTLDSIAAVNHVDAVRALAGRPLREEVYGLDGSAEEGTPFLIREFSHGIRVLQARQRELPASVQVIEDQQLECVIERNVRSPLAESEAPRQPQQPRIHHTLAVAHDARGLVTRRVNVAYGHLRPLNGAQGRTWVTVDDRQFHHHVEDPFAFRVGTPTAEQRLAAWAPLSWTGKLWQVDDVRVALAAATKAPPGGLPPAVALNQLQLLEARYLEYWSDEPGSGSRARLGTASRRALLRRELRLAFTADMVASSLGPERLKGIDLSREGGYVPIGHVEVEHMPISIPGDAWWAPSPEVIYDLGRFMLAKARRDPFGNNTYFEWDQHALHLAKVTDAYGNTTEIETDYRALAPRLIVDANLNRSAFKFDANARLVAMALLGKAGRDEGDSLESPTAEFHYDLRTQGQPMRARSREREQHRAADTRWRDTITYTDGSGREILRKMRAESGPVSARDSSGALVLDMRGLPMEVMAGERWVGSGRVIHNDKGNPIRQYEPYFSSSSDFEADAAVRQWGVSSTMTYDALDRLVRTDHPDGSQQRVVYRTWSQERWDEGDLVQSSNWTSGILSAQGVQDDAKRLKRCVELSQRYALTPQQRLLDALGRVCELIDLDGKNAPRIARQTLDALGNVLAIQDADGIYLSATRLDLLKRPLHDASAAAGDTFVLHACDGTVLRRWTARGHRMRHLYDQLRRQTHLFVLDPLGDLPDATGPPPEPPPGSEAPDEPGGFFDFLSDLVSSGDVDDDGPAPRRQGERLVHRVFHGESVSDPDKARKLNLMGKVRREFDGAGLLTFSYDFKGNQTDTARRLRLAYRWQPDWTELSAERLDPDLALNQVIDDLERETFRVSQSFDALARVVLERHPDGTEIRPQYGDGGLLDAISARPRGQGGWQPVALNIDYNARGQRVKVAWGNGVHTRYAYDPLRFRLSELKSWRKQGGEGRPLQHHRYFHDVAGNIVEITDESDPTHFYKGHAEHGGQLFEYDALYQLTRAEGRELPSLPPDASDPLGSRLPHRADLQALARYTEDFSYDREGNLTALRHEWKGARPAVWTRAHIHEAGSNRLKRSVASGSPAVNYAYDASGNMLAMPHLPQMRWDAEGRLASVDRAAGARVWMSYDAQGQRVRKVHRHGQSVDERIYLGNYEVYRRRRAGSANVRMERSTSHLMDGVLRIAMLETLTRDDGDVVVNPVPRWRYQLSDHLGSSGIELDESSKLISFEEFHAFGTTSVAGQGLGEVSNRRYRYNGKERDEETGLNCQGARYMAPWLARWVSPDPAGRVDGENLYAYVRNGPINAVDLDGHDSANVVTPDGNTLSGTWDRFKQLAVDANVATRLGGGLKAVGGLLEASAGGATVVAGGAATATVGLAPLGVAAIGAGWLGVAHGVDTTASGMRQMWSGQESDTLTVAALSTLLPESTARQVDVTLGAVLTIGTALLPRMLAEKSLSISVEAGLGINSNAAKGVSESANAARALSRKLSAVEDAQATAARVRNLPDGRIRYYEAERTARTAGPSRGSSYVTEWNPANGNVRSWNEVYDQAGNVNRVHPKMINGQTVDSLHYPPTARELGR